MLKVNVVDRKLWNDGNIFYTEVKACVQVKREVSESFNIYVGRGRGRESL